MASLNNSTDGLGSGGRAPVLRSTSDEVRSPPPRPYRPRGAGGSVVEEIQTPPPVPGRPERALARDRNHSVWKKPQVSARRGETILGGRRESSADALTVNMDNLGSDSAQKKRNDTPNSRMKERESMPELSHSKRESDPEERVRGKSETKNLSQSKDSPRRSSRDRDEELDPNDVGGSVARTKSPKAKLSLEKIGNIKVPGLSPRPHSAARKRENESGREEPSSPRDKGGFSFSGLRKMTSKMNLTSGWKPQGQPTDGDSSVASFSSSPPNSHEEKRQSVQGSAQFMASVKLELNRQPIYMDMQPRPDANAEVDMYGVSDEGTVLMQGSSHHYELRAATLGKLVERLTVVYPDEHAAAQHYQKVFFMTYRSFASPGEVFEKLAQRFLGPSNIQPEEMVAWKTDLPTIRKQVIVAMKLWFTEHFKDFSAGGGALTKQLQEFLARAREVDTDSNSLVSFLDRMVEKKLSKGTYTSLFGCSLMIDKNTAPEPNAPKSFKGVTFWDLDELEIARQLTIGEYHIYAEIQPVELQDLAWSKAHLKERAPNVLAMINRFNKFSTAFSTMLVSAPKLKQRKKIIEKLVRIAEHLMSMNSFNMVMAIMSGFGNSSAYRLKHSFQAINRHSQEVLANLNEVLSSNSAYKAYRELLRSIDPPCIPFLGVYLSDLTFVDEGNKEKINGLWNFRKRVLEYDVIVQVLKYQAHNYNLHLVPSIGKILDELPIMEETEMHKLSLLHEPRKAKRKDIK